ncbi:kinesin light chain [Delitschia confertaspora ATCC 74209]|uniref:Kinesin light chain n=1 Tax=Delitschia confertaspora ATCC 74209 TaxID=1513339 RepID=A0A9P4MW65_9PLEO|nr:kinesin light chain [Delitschia confertaspora ATCC 74209]
MASSKQQLYCTDYHVAWICPVADIELLPARLMLDEEHAAPPYDTHYDDNTYIFGMISGHTIVVVTCSQGETGNVNAGRLTGSMFKTFPNIRMTVLVGIGGGIPRSSISKDSLNDIHLGDVVVGWPGDGKPACVSYDRGRSKANGQFEIVGTMQNPDWKLTNALSILTTDHESGRTKFNDQLARLQHYSKFAHPGLEHDRLFKADYHHIGEYGSNCAACDKNELVQRPPRTEKDKSKLVFHRGRISTGNSVIQDGQLRDQISARCGEALCIEMEAAGVDMNRKCLVIRGISDYADTYKDDIWRSHAAGNTAAFTRELLCRIQPNVNKEIKGVVEGPWFVPFSKPKFFVGRETELDQLSSHILSEGCQRLGIYGLGGCGKTALALECAYRTKQQQPTRAILWVPVISRESFEQAYREIEELLHIPGIADEKADVKRLVKAKLSDEGFGQWLMIVDNADDVSVLFDPIGEGDNADRLINCLPRSRKGSIIFTTRTREVAIKLAESNVIALGKLEQPDAKEMLRKRLIPEHQHQLEDGKTVDKFLDMPTFLALAIVQAVAFVNTNGISLSEYILIFRENEGHATDLLHKEFEDQSRYRDANNPVATTWYISFEQIRKRNELAATHLSFMACTANNDIPTSMLLPSPSKVEQIEAIGILKAYTFITERDTQKAFDVHPLVHLAMRGWLKANNQWNYWTERTLLRLVDIVPLGDYNTREIWTTYLPHALDVVYLPEIYGVEARILLLDRIGHCEWTLGRYKTAEKMHREMLALREKVSGKEHPFTLTTMNNLAHILNDQGKYAEAEKVHREMLALIEKMLGKEHLFTLTTMNNLADTLGGRRKYAEAKKMHREMLALREKVSEKEHPFTLTTMNNLAHILSDQGKYGEAEKMHRETLALREETLGMEHPDTLSSVHHLAYLLQTQKRYVEASILYTRAYKSYERTFGPQDSRKISCLNNYTAMQRMVEQQ